MDHDSSDIIPPQQLDIGPAHSSKCNRHLSRITHHILENEVLPILRHYTKHLIHHDDNNNSQSSEEIRLDQFLTQLLQNNPQCILYPPRNIFSYQELKHSIIPTVRHPTGGSALYKCELCGKQFVSRFYLDRHFDAHHSHQISEDPNHNHDWICPATDICPILAGGVHACDEIAAKHSSYGPGSIGSDSGGGGSSGGTSGGVGFVYGGHDYERSITASHLFHSMLHPHHHHHESPTHSSSSSSSILDSPHSCHESTMSHYREECSNMMHRCFDSIDQNIHNNEQGQEQSISSFSAPTATSSSLSNDLISNICDKLTCSHKIHKLAGHGHSHSSNSYDTIHILAKEEWESHSDFRLGFLGGFVLVSIVLFSICTTVFGFGWLGLDLGEKVNVNAKKQLSKRKTL